MVGAFEDQADPAGLHGSLPFEIGNNLAAGNDGIAAGVVLPGSTTVSVSCAAPEPGSLASLPAGVTRGVRGRGAAGARVRSGAGSPQCKGTRKTRARSLDGSMKIPRGRSEPAQ